MQKTVYSWKNPRPAAPKLADTLSITAPGPNLTIRQIMDRYSRGMPLTQGIKQPQYHNGEFPDIAGLDLTEIQELKRQANANVKRIQDDLQRQKTEAYNAEQKKLFDQIETLKKQLDSKGTPARGKVEGDSPNIQYP